MSRNKQKGDKPIHNYNLYFGFDTDVKKWFIELELLQFKKSSNIKWFDNEKEWIDFKKKFLKRQ